MNVLQYQEWTINTAIYPGAGSGDDRELIYLGLGIASEAGEVAGKIKKIIRDGKFDPGAIISECSDVLWYLARLADSMGCTLEDLAEVNYGKLTRRVEKGTLSGDGDER